MLPDDRFTGDDMTAPDDVTDASSLAGAVLQAEAERQAEQQETDVLFADDLLPGVGDEKLTLKEGVAVGGTFTFVMLLMIAGFENFESATLGVLAPDIRDASVSAMARSCSSPRRRVRSSCWARCRWAISPTASGDLRSSSSRRCCSVCSCSPPD